MIKSVIAIDISSLPAYVQLDLSPSRRARGGGVSGGRSCFDTEPGVLPIMFQQLESKSIKGVGNDKNTGVWRER